MIYKGAVKLNSNPSKVSIIMPTYNCGKYIEAAIQSALSQTYKNIEIIVIDDGSTDNTQEILDKYIKNEQIYYIYQKNQGVSKARNTGIFAARGTYIATLDADDTWSNDRLEKMVIFLEDSSADLVISNFYLVDENRKRLKEKAVFAPTYSQPLLQQQYKTLLYQATAFALMLVKKEVLIEAGGYDESLKGEAEDYDLWLRLLATGKKWAYYPEPLVEMMVRVGSLSKGYSKKRKVSLKKIAAKQTPYIGGIKAFIFYRYHLGGYRLDMLLVSIREKNKKKIYNHSLILLKSLFFGSMILLKKIAQNKGGE